MKRFAIILVMLFAGIRSAAAQTEEFMKVYNIALDAFNRLNAGTRDDCKGLSTLEFSGKMLRSILPERAGDPDGMLWRIKSIRQIKFPAEERSPLFEKLLSAADSDAYERLSIINVEGQTIYIYTAPDKGDDTEFLVLIVEGQRRLACDIVGRVTLDDILDLIYGRN